MKHRRKPLNIRRKSISVLAIPLSKQTLMRGVCVCMSEFLFLLKVWIFFYLHFWFVVFFGRHRRIMWILVIMEYRVYFGLLFSRGFCECWLYGQIMERRILWIWIIRLVNGIWALFLLCSIGFVICLECHLSTKVWVLCVIVGLGLILQWGIWVAYCMEYGLGGSGCWSVDR